MINMVDEDINSMRGEDDYDDDAEANTDSAVEAFDVNYSCLRCGTTVSNTELSRLPEIKCICGFRVFTKVRPPVVKTVKAI